jgi:dephospho-CoA kinase
LFRDYLRAEESARRSYETIKRRLAEIYPSNIDGYLSIKDPVMDIIYLGAEFWARARGWQPSSDFE